MGKMKEYDRSAYKSVEDAVHSLMKDHWISGDVYTPAALEAVLTFLCLNNIGHTYSETKGANQHKLVTLTCDEIDETIYWYEQKEESSYYLIRYADNYEDEFEVSGFVVLTSREMNDFDTALNVLETIMESTELSFYFGTNEEMVYDDFKFFLEAISVSVLSKSEGAFMLKQFGKSYGTHPYFHIMDLVKNYKEDANDKV
jgi:hypothetical protein